jgi:hypothetical protein
MQESAQVSYFPSLEIECFRGMSKSVSDFADGIEVAQGFLAKDSQRETDPNFAAERRQWSLTREKRFLL